MDFENLPSRIEVTLNDQGEVIGYEPELDQTERDAFSSTPDRMRLNGTTYLKKYDEGEIVERPFKRFQRRVVYEHQRE